MRFKRSTEKETPIKVIKAVPCPNKNGVDKSLNKMIKDLSHMDLGKVEVRERVLLVCPGAYTVARVIVTYGDKKPRRVIGYGLARKGRQDTNDQNTGVNIAMSRARGSVTKKLRRKQPIVGGWYEA